MSTDMDTSLLEWLSKCGISPNLRNEDIPAKDLLVFCATAIHEEKKTAADFLMQILRRKVSVYGNPLERLGAYMFEGLVARLHASGHSIYSSLTCSGALAVDLSSCTQKLFEILPYVKFAYMAANGAIAEASIDETKIHIVDFQIHQGIQWLSLLQAMATRPGGPPSIRISAIDDPTCGSYPVGGMNIVRQRLTTLATRLDVPFEFNTISARLTQLQPHMIDRRPGEALIMNFGLQLHHLPDESVSLENPRDRILRLAKTLNPKVLTLIEQENNTNTTPFLTRFKEALDYYGAIFESIDAALPRESKDRLQFEEQCIAREIVNITACEGLQRVERHELLGKWKLRMSMAGFRPHPLSSYVNLTIQSLLASYNRPYSFKEEGEALLLGWRNRPLVSASAWV